MLKTKRLSNIELLRILSIFLIILFHSSLKSTIVNGPIINIYFNSFAKLFGELGVNLFALTTGYFMCKSKPSLKKVICIILEAQFYYILLTLIAINLGIVEAPNIKGIFLLFFTIFL